MGTFEDNLQEILKTSESEDCSISIENIEEIDICGIQLMIASMKFLNIFPLEISCTNGVAALIEKAGFSKYFNLTTF